MNDVIYFAIGDIHGEAAKLAALHGAILDRIAFEKAPAHIVHLGDYVDRGPDSSGVITQVTALQQRFADDPAVKVTALLGNHEEMMLSAWSAGPGAPDEGWIEQGGREAVASYLQGKPLEGDWRARVPKAHMRWIASLPHLLYDRERRLVFVHAGIEPANFPDCSEHVHLWTRSPRFMDDALWPQREELDGLVVVHGHTPRSYEPEITTRRINVDTAACFGGPLTAVVLKPGAPPEFLMAR